MADFLVGRCISLGNACLVTPRHFLFWLRALRTFRTFCTFRTFRVFHGFFLLLKFKNNKILTDRLGQRRPGGAARARQCYCYIYHIIVIIFASHYSYSLLSRTLSLTSIPMANFTSGDQVEVGMLMLYDLIPI